MVSDCETVFWKFNPSNQAPKRQAKLWAYVLKTLNIVVEILSTPIWMSLFQAFELCSLEKTALNLVKPVKLYKFGMIKRVILHFPSRA